MFHRGAAELWKTDLRRKQSAQVTTELAAEPRLTPDGNSIAYLDQTGTNIWAVPLDGGPPRQVTDFRGGVGGAIANYAWSSDGTRLALLRRTVTEDIVLFRLQP